MRKLLWSLWIVAGLSCVAVADEGHRFDGLYGAARVAEMGSQPSQAAEYYALLLKTCEGSMSDRPELAKAKQAVVAAK